MTATMPLPFGNRNPGENDKTLSIETNLDLDGKPSRERAFADRETLWILNGAQQRRFEAPFHRIGKIRVAAFVGSHYLQVSVDGKWIDILRQSGCPSREIREFAVRLQKRIQCQNLGKESTDFPAESNLSVEAEPSPNSQERPSSSAERASSRRVAQLLFQILVPYRWNVAILLGLSMGAVAIEIVPPLLQRVLVDRVLQAKLSNNIQGQLTFLLVAIVGGLFTLRAAAAAVAVVKGMLASRVGSSMTADMRNELVGKLNVLPMAFHNRNQVGALMSQVAYDTETLHTLIYHLTSGFLLQTLQLMGVGAMLFYLNAKLAAIALLPMPFIVFGGWRFTRHLQPRNRHYWEAVGKQASALVGMLGGMRVVKSFAQEDREAARFRVSSDRLRDSRISVDGSIAIFSAAMGLLFAMGILTVWYLGGRDVMTGAMTLGSLMAFLAYLAVFYTPLTTLSESTTWFANFFTISRRIGELLDRQDEPGIAEPSNPRAEPLGAIEFQDVSFSYGGSLPALKRVSFAIAPGEMIGVAGRSGSGKSTLVNLITKLYEADCGRILASGIDVRRWNTRELRRKIGVVPQDPFLFRSSIAENIAYGNASATPRQILEAAKNSDAHDFILRLPFGYSTQLGEGGMGLSGGERQRLSIARALLSDPDVLILDEATANVDAESERAICGAIRRNAKKRTVIAIAHRLSTLQSADRILVFDDGCLVEQGTPVELLAANGMYALLAGMQGVKGENRRRKRTPIGAAARESKVGKFISPHFFLTGTHFSSLSADMMARSVHRRSNGNGHKTQKLNRLRWLEPLATAIERNRCDEICVTLRGKRFRGAYALRAFPGKHDDGYISLRRRDKMGREVEIGLIESLNDWPANAQQAVRASLDRRYLLHAILGIRRLNSRGNVLSLSIETRGGSRDIQVEKTGESVQPFGNDGLLVNDRTGNIFVVADRGTLPKKQRRLLDLYFGIS